MKPYHLGTDNSEMKISRGTLQENSGLLCVSLYPPTVTGPSHALVRDRNRVVDSRQAYEIVELGVQSMSGNSTILFTKRKANQLDQVGFKLIENSLILLVSMNRLRCLRVCS